MESPWIFVHVFRSKHVRSDIFYRRLSVLRSEIHELEFSVLHKCCLLPLGNPGATDEAEHCCNWKESSKDESQAVALAFIFDVFVVLESVEPLLAAGTFHLQ